jgi:hypothetical protein
MQLPVKFVPKQNHHLSNVVGAVVIILMALAFMMSYLPDRAAAENANLTFGEWLGFSGVRLPFLLVTIAVLLFGLVALTVSLINMLSGSPYSHFIVDRFGIQSRTFFSENRYSWKDLGPIRPLRRSVLQAFSLDRRFWIVSDTFSGEGRNDTRRALSSFTLRIPVASYLGSSWFGGNIVPAMEATAAWLESLRRLAREDNLGSGEVPDAPPEVGLGQSPERPAEIIPAAAKPAKSIDPDLPAMADRKFGRRDGPTIER